MDSFLSKSCVGDILIIDDQADNLRVLARMLAEKGYRVRKALQTAAALRAIKVSQPDLILLDIKMPDMDGYQLCSQIKSDSELQDIPIIFISALDEVFSKIRAFDLGGVDYISKPFHSGEVIARIRNQLTIQRQKKDLKNEIEKRLEIESILYQSRALINTVLNSSLDGIAVLQAVRDLDGYIGDFRCILVNRMLTQMLKSTQEELMGKLFLRRFLQKSNLDLFDEFIEIVDYSQSLDQEIYYQKDEEEDKWYHLIATKLGDGISVVIRDITDKKKLELKLAKLTKSDEITGIGNRAFFEDSLRKEWERALRDKHSLSLMLIQLDQPQDSGNQDYLVLISQILKINLSNLVSVVARYGDQELAILLPKLTESAVVNLGHQCQEQVRNLKLDQGRGKALTLSMGIASRIPTIVINPSQLLAEADLALYQAKQEGGDRLVVYQSVAGS